MSMTGVLLVTGASSGIGLATVKAFLNKGVRRVVAADVAPALDTEMAALSKEFPDADILIHKCNVADEDEVKSMVAAAVSKFGRLDYGVNCAGVAHGAPFESFDTETWDKTIGVNERGVFFCMREQLKVMAAQDYAPAKDERRKQRGAIVNIASLAGQVGLMNCAAYVASKHAVMGLAKVATIEYAHKGVRTNCVAPGWIKTNMTQGSEGSKAIYEWGTRPDHTPMHRGGIPEEIADVIVFLCSEEASFVSGATWNIDGGYMCN